MLCCAEMLLLCLFEHGLLCRWRKLKRRLSLTTCTTAYQTSRWAGPSWAQEAVHDRTSSSTTFRSTGLHLHAISLDNPSTA